MAAELIQATGGRVEQMEQHMGQVRQMSDIQMLIHLLQLYLLHELHQAMKSCLRPFQGPWKSTLGSSVRPPLWWSPSARYKNLSPRESLSQILRRSCSPSLPKKAKVTENPQPSVNWERASRCPLSDATNSFYDNINNQHILKIKTLTLEDADVYKCVGSNKHREAIYSTSLIVPENPALDFKKMLKKRSVEKSEEKRPPTEEEMLKILAGADKRDYERICAEHGFTDFRGILKKLKEMKKKVEVEMVRVLKPLEDITATAGTSIVFDTILELKDPNIRMQWFMAQSCCGSSTLMGNTK